MSMGKMELYDAALVALNTGTLGNLASVGIAAALLDGTHVANLDTGATWADVSAKELTDADYVSKALSTTAITEITGGIKFSADDISFGNPVTILDAKYLVFVVGTAGALNPLDKLLAIADLRTEGGTLGASGAELTFKAPAGGWFTMTRA